MNEALRRSANSLRSALVLAAVLGAGADLAVASPMLRSSSPGMYAQTHAFKTFFTA
jgi:hypothetical protein